MDRMRTDQVHHVIEDYLEAMVQRGDFGRFFADDVVLTIVGTPQSVTGRDEVVGLIRAMHEEAFAGQPELKTLVTSDQNVALEADFVGTHQGDFNGLAATGRQVRVPYAVVYDLDGDKITALRIYGLAQGLLEQLTS
jgi:predicted ester cyclase